MKDASSGYALAAPDIGKAPYAGSARAARQVRCGSRRLGRQPTSTMPPPPWKRDGADLGCKCVKVMTSGRVLNWREQELVRSGHYRAQEACCGSDDSADKAQAETLW